MGLSSALQTGLSGLIVNQTDLSVVGNNIANANTTAFKSSQVLNTPQFYITSNPGGPPTSTFGGTNPSQVGLGAQVGQVVTNFTPGQVQTTGVSSDLAINGNGFFVVTNASQESLYSRDGAFTLNSNNQLVDSSGNILQGYGVDNKFNLASTLGPLQINVGTTHIAQATQNIAIQGKLNAGGTLATGASVLTTGQLQAVGGGTVDLTTTLTNLQNFGASGTLGLFNVGQTITLDGPTGDRAPQGQSLTVTSGTTVQDLETFLSNGLAIDTSPPTGTPGPTPGGSIQTVAGGGQTLQITGNVGSDNQISLSAANLTVDGAAAPLTFTDTGGATGESVQSPLSAFDSLGNSVTVNVNAVLVSQSSTSTTWDYTVSSADNLSATAPPTYVLGSGTLSFDNNGQLLNVTGGTSPTATGSTFVLQRSGNGASPNQAITLNFSGVTALSTDGAPSQLSLFNQDGLAAGTLTSYSVGPDGTITGTFDAGQTRTIGQVALVTFKNQNGLVNQGSNVYAAGPASGPANVTTAGQNGSGTILGGALEQSNVDLSQEFINLITASTGYDASSRVITTANQLLTELLNTAR
jgi:flagellar hook protein FlgE